MGVPYCGHSYSTLVAHKGHYGTVFSCTGRKEGRGLSHRHHISCQRRDRVQLHGAKGGEGPFASTPQQSTDEAAHGI
jgi:hypothetical protein